MRVRVGFPAPPFSLDSLGPPVVLELSFFPAILRSAEYVLFVLPNSKFAFFLRSLLLYFLDLFLFSVLPFLGAPRTGFPKSVLSLASRFFFTDAFFRRSFEVCASRTVRVGRPSAG